VEVAAGIHRIETEFAGRVNAVYYLWGEQRSLLVDTTTKQTAPEVLARIGELGAPIPSYVLNTHSDWDHVAGNGVIRDAAPVSTFIAHLRDRRMIEHVDVMIDERYSEFAHDHGFDETEESKAAVRDGTSETTIDLAVTGGEQLRLGPDWTVTVLHTPGHSHGSISVDDPRSNCLIVGDAVLGAAVPLASGAPAFPPTYRYLDDYLATIDELAHRAPGLLLTSHYPVYSGAEVTAFLDASRDFTVRAEQLLIEELSGGAARPLLEIAESMSANLGRWPSQSASALLFPLSGHLERLVARGQVQPSRTANYGRACYTWTTA
jgi:glyoxylase-like metal-dependent hydrolase (beta-lactamase superfamily II)